MAIVLFILQTVGRKSSRPESSRNIERAGLTPRRHLKNCPIGGNPMIVQLNSLTILLIEYEGIRKVPWEKISNH